MVVRVGEATPEIDDPPDRLAAKESMRESDSICRESQEDFRHMLTPLGNQLAPKPGQDGEFLEQGKKPITWFVTQKHPFDQFRVSRSCRIADRIHSKAKARPL
jgi:hypothetical protein